MSRYEVPGLIELNFGVTVEADSEDEAERLGREAAEDGQGLDIPTGHTEVLTVREVPDAD